jgi:uncharacterized DUF497 family protein
MDTAFSGFDWDDGNRDKCRKHGVSIGDIEAVFYAPLAVFPTRPREANEQRLKAIGIGASGRHIFVVFTLRRRESEVLVRPISARYMHKKEVDHYERQAIPTEKVANPEDG